MTVARSSVLAAMIAIAAVPARSAELEPVSPDKMPSLAWEIAMQVMKCWIPAGTKSDDIVVLDIRLNPDGSLAQPPQLNLKRADAALPSPDATAAAIRAVEHCAPYELPAGLYERWKDQKVTFDPTELRYEGITTSP